MKPASPANPAKDAFRLMDLLNEVKTVSLAIVEFQLEHADKLKDVAVKRLGVMSDALDLIFENGCKEFCKISSVKSLHQSYAKCKIYDNKRKQDDPMRSLTVRPIGELRSFIKRAKKTHDFNLKRPVALTR